MRKDKFEVGDVVYCVMYGKGVVESIDDERNYPVTVKFDVGRKREYTKDGTYYTNGNRTLFFEEIPTPDSAYVRPKWRAKSGELFFIVSEIGEIEEYTDNRWSSDNKKFESGNYFQSEEEAKESKFYKVFHE